MSNPHEETPDAGKVPEYAGLEVQVETTAPCVATVRFTVRQEEIKKMRGRGLQNLGRNARYKGFRPGKAPVHLLERDYGTRVDAELVQLFMNQAYDTAVRREGLRPAATPRIDEEGVDFNPSADFRHEFQVWLRPEVELGEYKGLAIEGASTLVSEEEVETAIAEFKRRESRPEEAGEEGLAVDGVASCRIEFLVPEEEEPVLHRDGIRLNPTTPLNGVDKDAFAKELTGAKQGEQRELAFAFPDDFPLESARGRTGIVRLTLTEVYRIIPPTDEEFLRLIGVENEEEMRTTLHQRMTEAKEEQERTRVEMALIDRLIEENAMELPEEMVAMQAEAKVTELRASLGELEVGEAELEERLAVEREQAMEQTARAMRAVYIMEEIARREEVDVTKEDVMGELQQIAERNGTSIDEVRKYYQEQGLFQQLGLELLERKVRSFLRESADIQSPG